MTPAENSSPLRQKLPAVIVLAVCAALVWVAKGMPLYTGREIVTVGQRAPDFNLLRLDGQSLRLSYLRGSTILVVFGRTDHEDSVRQLEEIRKMSAQYREWGLVILFLAQNEPVEQVESFVEEKGSAAAILFDNNGRVSNQYHVSRWPTSFVIDKTGVVRATRAGVWKADNEVMNAALAQYLRSGTRNAPPPPGAETALPIPEDLLPEGAKP